MNILNTIELPLKQSNLIEASAGTGKTYTMANIYLRLILGVGCAPLTPEQILVVTFTKAATQELRDRIRSKLRNVAKWFQDPESSEAQTALQQDPFLAQLYSHIQPERSKALLRLRVAEKDMDLAAIFTIDSFCQKMLFQYAFDSGVRFDLTLLTDESELLKRLSEEVWRECFYPADLTKTTLIAAILRNPSHALSQVKHYLSDILPPLSNEQQQWLLADNREKSSAYLKLLTETKRYWQENRQEMVTILLEHLTILNNQSYQARYLTSWQKTLDEWADSDNTQFLVEPLNRFSQTFVTSKTKKAQTLVSHLFEQVEQFIQQFEQNFIDFHHQIQTQIVYEYLTALKQKLAEYKQTHTEKNFTDMLTYFHQALHSEKGAELAEKIRQQFQFAMIDESQDTNQIQYDIFRTLFISEKEGGFIMIGDPKQSIYKFRGADIFSYLNAANDVTAKYTLNRNWRSLPDIVEGVNYLFDFSQKDEPNVTSGQFSPFLYKNIAFHAVDSKHSSTRLSDDKRAWNLYLQPNAYNKGHLKNELLAEQCADQIQQQLSQAQQGEILLVEESSPDMPKNQISRPLVAQDIAILVRSHKDAALIKHALAKRNIQSVYLSEDNSVYASREAQDLAFILTACLYPYQPNSILTALSTSLWGLTAERLYQLKNSESDWEQEVEQFIHYRQIWQTQGILPMIHKMSLQQGIITRLNGIANADRRLTNLLHLSELLQEASKQSENEFALLRWFQQQIANPNSSDEQILRLESEEKLIKIITIHKSKGLEYPVVWLPFIARKSLGAQTNEVMSLYRDENQQLCWDFNSRDETVKQLRNEAEYAEDLRLLYVALTRAKYQLHLILPDKFSKSWNAMHYLLTNGHISEGTPTESMFQHKKIKHTAITLSEGYPPVRHYHAHSDSQPILATREFTQIIKNHGQITSFSALQSQNERLQQFHENQPLVQDHAKDYDTKPALSNTQTTGENEHDTLFSPHNFPHSTKVGNLLHKLFENWDFQQPLDETTIEELCLQLDLDTTFIGSIKEWLERIIHTTFCNGISLAQLSPNKQLKEWQFYLRLSNEKALPQLNQLLKRESRLAKSLPDLQLKQLNGFIKGFVDLIVEHQGKFYIIDYKSNFLGYSGQDYQQENLEKTIGLFRYDLQYLLYTLALHRYLRSRMGENYRYADHFGGVAYLFLRGMDGTPNSGVYFECPSQTLIEELDRLLG